MAGRDVPPKKWTDGNETDSCERQPARDRTSEQFALTLIVLRGAARRASRVGISPVPTGKAILLHMKILGKFTVPKSFRRGVAVLCDQ